MKRSSLRDFSKTLDENLAGSRVGVYSVCSAHPYAIRAALLRAARDGSIALIESTSNQVNHLGGYTGQTPAEFVRSVTEMAGEVGLAQERILFGGDHLGPYPWHDRPSAECLELASSTVRAYVAAGYQKIHLDVSMYLGDDPRTPGKALRPDLVASRTAELCRISERTWEQEHGSGERPIYVVGNEVPVPGGTSLEEGELAPSSAESVLESVHCLERAFREEGLSDAWERVRAVVAQPGVEFGDNLIVEYDPEKTRNLAGLVAELPGLVYEAHSTDYQRRESLAGLIADHFAILKVGPALTFAFREAVNALESIETELFRDGPGERSRVLECAVDRMKADPRHWKSYYTGSETEIDQSLRYSFSDRIRYYWTDRAVRDSLRRLFENLNRKSIPLPLLSQYLPHEYELIREGRLAASPEALILSHLERVIDDYSSVCLGENVR